MLIDYTVCSSFITTFLPLINGRINKEITPNILIIHDRNDLVIPYIDSKELAEKLENVVLHTTRGLGHKRILNDSSVIDLTVKHFEGKGG